MTRLMTAIVDIPALLAFRDEVIAACGAAYDLAIEKVVPDTAAELAAAQNNLNPIVQRLPDERFVLALEHLVCLTDVDESHY
ncbi:MAG: hypothetical protein WDM89_22445 [Rhizomicrobium sp.]